MKKKEKIYFLTHSLGFGGAERVISNLANFFSKEYEVEILTIVDMGIAYPLDKTIKVNQFGNKTDSGLIKKIKNSMNVLKYIKQNKPDIIISFCPTMCYVACYGKMFNKGIKNAKLIISERNNPASEYKNKLIKTITNFLYKKADLVVFQTQDAMNFFNKKIQDKGVIIPNPINEKFIGYKNKNKKEDIIISVGRLEPQKNHELLIKSFAKIKDEIPQYKLKIFGDGSLKSHLENLIVELNCSEQIMLMGKTDNIIDELSKSKIFVMPSDYEGMPNALMEAMTMGLACISTDCPCGGPKMLIENEKNGILIPVGDVDKLSEAILELSTNKEKQKKVSENALKIIDNYNPNAIYEKWNKLIQ